MKKAFGILFIILLTFSCSSDDNNDNVNGIKNPYTGSVVGLWQTVALSVDGEAWT